jgi:hypothetical protein
MSKLTKAQIDFYNEKIKANLDKSKEDSIYNAYYY